MSAIKFAAAMFRGTSMMTPLAMIDIMAPPSHRKSVKPKKNTRTEAQKAARKIRDAKKRETA